VGRAQGRQQLRDAALKSILYAIAFIVLYVASASTCASRPAASWRLCHDALTRSASTWWLQKEMTLGTDRRGADRDRLFDQTITIVVYDRVRENMQRMRTANLAHLINVSTSQTLGRTVITSGVAMSLRARFFICA